MNIAVIKESLLVNFASQESKLTVTRKTVKAMKVQLGFATETQLILYALAALRDTVMPAYEKDNGPVPETMIKHISKTVDQNFKGGKTLF